MKKFLLLTTLYLFLCTFSLAQKQSQELSDSLQAALKNYDAHRTELNKTNYDSTEKNK